MPIELPKDKFAGQVRSITLGATADQGGTRPDPSYFTGSFTLANLVTTSPWASRTYTGNFQVRTWIGRLQRAQPVSGD